MKVRHYPRATPAFRRNAVMVHVATVAVLGVALVAYFRGDVAFAAKLAVIPVVTEILIAVGYLRSSKW